MNPGNTSNEIFRALLGHQKPKGCRTAAFFPRPVRFFMRGQMEPQIVIIRLAQPAFLFWSLSRNNGATMSRPTVFYAWQSDLPRSNTRDLIHNATANAIQRIASTMSLVDSPRIDHDTLNESGAPAITETILRKICESAVFVADISLVAETTPKQGQTKKRLPNANVMLELGYAAATIGWDRVVLVMNKHYGSPESLPFDLRNRRFPITYQLGPESSRVDRCQSVAADIEVAIRTALTAEYQRVTTILSKLSSYTRSIMLKHAGQIFWESASDNKVLSRMDLAINQMLEWGIIECVEAASERGLAYSWTYLGQKCCQRLGVQIPVVNSDFETTVVPSNVTVDVSFYDSLFEE